ncbi:MAG: DUF4381 domain-containing protein [Planctomycetota bacterium]
MTTQAQQDPGSLARLHDIVAADPAPAWPPAPGWIFVLAILVAAASATAVALTLRWRANAYRRAATRELERVLAEEDWPRLSEVLKRTALAAFPRERVAGLTGSAWLAFLDRTGGTREFTEGPARALETLAFDPAAAERVSDADARAAQRSCAAWVLRHRADRPRAVSRAAAAEGLDP